MFFSDMQEVFNWLRTLTARNGASLEELIDKGFIVPAADAAHPTRWEVPDAEGLCDFLKVRNATMRLGGWT